MDPRLLNEIYGASSLSELQKSVEANVRQLGFRYFIYHGRFPRADIGAGDVYFDNCPDGWGARYGERGGGFLGLRGPHDVTPALWQELALQEPTLFADARRFGLVTGSIHPVHGPDGQKSSLSFIKDKGGVQAEQEVEAALAYCHLIASYVHEAAARIVGCPRGDAISPSAHRRSGGLNERECQVLAWAADGKTMVGIADILSISQRTVLFHLANARRKLGAANSRHAISKALALGLIEVGASALRTTSAGGRDRPGRR